MANVREFPLTALYCAAGDGNIEHPVKLCAPFVPRKGLHFYALHAHSFLIIRTLHYCNLCTELGRVANVREFPLTELYRAAGSVILPGLYSFALYCAPADGDIERTVQLCAPFAPR